VIKFISIIGSLPHLLLRGLNTAKIKKRWKKTIKKKMKSKNITVKMKEKQ